MQRLGRAEHGFLHSRWVEEADQVAPPIDHKVVDEKLHGRANVQIGTCVQGGVDVLVVGARLARVQVLKAELHVGWLQPRVLLELPADEGDGLVVLPGQLLQVGSRTRSVGHAPGPGKM